VLVLVTVAAAGYFFVHGRSSSSSSSGNQQDFVHTSRRIVADGRSIPTMASKVHRFLELRAFDQSAYSVLLAMGRDAHRLHQIASGSSGNDKTIADQAASAGDQAVDAATRYEKAVALTYRLGNASAAEEDLKAALATLQQEEQAWAHR
jgi:hypothetical protein